MYLDQYETFLQVDNLNAGVHSHAKRTRNSKFVKTSQYLKNGQLC